MIAEIVRKEGQKACAFPEKIRVRKVGGTNIREISSTLAQSFTLDNRIVSASVKTGFSCKNEDQLGGLCHDYEIQLCCPRKLPYLNWLNLFLVLCCN